MHILGLRISFDINWFRWQLRLPMIPLPKSYISRQIELFISKPSDVVHHAKSLRSPRPLHKSTGASSSAVPAPVAFVLFDGDNILDRLIDRLLRGSARRPAMIRVIATSIGPKGSVVGPCLLLFGVPGGETLRDGVGIADIVELGDAEAVLQSQTTYVDGLVAHDALNEVLRVPCLMAFAAEMSGTAEVCEVAEALLTAILHVLDATHMIETTARLHQTLEHYVRVVGERILLLLPSRGEMRAVGVVVIVGSLMFHLATLRTDLLHLHVRSFFDLALIDELLVVVRIVSFLLAEPAGISVIQTVRALPSVPLFAQRRIYQLSRDRQTVLSVHSGWKQRRQGPVQRIRQ